MLYPGNDRSVIETNRQLGAHANVPAFPDDNPRDIRRPRPYGHEIDDGDRTLRGLVIGLKDERVWLVAPRRRRSGVGRRNPPPAVVFASQERGEGCTRVEPGKAKPIDGSGSGDERGRPQIPDEPVVL